MEIEYIGELLPDGHLSIEPEVVDRLEKGVKVKIIIEIPVIDEKREMLSPAAKRLVASMENAKAIGLPSDPQEISHSKLAEEQMEEKFPWLG